MIWYYSMWNYVQNEFEVTINDQDMIVRLEDWYKKAFIVYEGRYNYNQTIVESDIFNKINYEKTFILNINEYEIYLKNGKRQPIDSYNKDCLEYNCTLIVDNDKMMKVQRLGKTIYEGKFKNDISDIVTEDGRYYFHIYTKSKRKDTLFAYVKTNIHFNVLVGDYNVE